MLGQCLGRNLVAEQIERFGRRPDEYDALLAATPRQRGILGKEAVAGMQGVAPGRLRGCDDCVDIEIGACALPRNFMRRVGCTDVQRCGVVRGIDGDGGKPCVCRGARDANGNLAAIGDQQPLKEHESVRWHLWDLTAKSREPLFSENMKPRPTSHASQILFRITENTPRLVPDLGLDLGLLAGAASCRMTAD